MVGSYARPVEPSSLTFQDSVAGALLHNSVALLMDFVVVVVVGQHWHSLRIAAAAETLMHCIDTFLEHWTSEIVDGHFPSLLASVAVVGIALALDCPAEQKMTSSCYELCSSSKL